MSREINHDAILALDAEIIRLKRTRNSLLNIARIPPEILGHIFRFNVAEVGNPHFAKIPKGSYNFLLVCHHWFQVALLTPELWTSWGNSLKDWKRWYLRSGISTLDLILDGQNREDGDFDEALRDALRDRAARNVIRKVHLTSNQTGFLTPIISSLIPEGEGVRSSSIESIVLRKVDASDLFTRCRFPKLCNLHLSGYFKISSWDHLKSTTTALTSLSLGPADTLSPSPSVIPTTSQILSLLTSNPNLRSLMLNSLFIDDDSEYDTMLQVPLRHLEWITLMGSFHDVFPILRRLEFPERTDYVAITLHDCTPQGVLEDVGPCIRDYLRRDPRFRDSLGMLLRSHTYCISVCASVVGVGHRGPDRQPPSAKLRKPDLAGWKLPAQIRPDVAKSFARPPHVPRQGHMSPVDTQPTCYYIIAHNSNCPQLPPCLSPVSHEMEDLQIKTPAAEPDTITELVNMLEVRRDLRRQYRYVCPIDCGCGFSSCSPENINLQSSTSAGSEHLAHQPITVTNQNQPKGQFPRLVPLPDRAPDPFLRSTKKHSLLTA